MSLDTPAEHQEGNARLKDSGTCYLVAALQLAIDDLYKAANQFKGLIPDGNNWIIFEYKAERAEKILNKYGEISE